MVERKKFVESLVGIIVGYKFRVKTANNKVTLYTT